MAYQTLDPNQISQVIQQNPVLKSRKWNQNPTKMANWYNKYLSGGGQDILGGTTTTSPTTPSVPMAYGTNYPQFSYQFDPNQYLPGIQQQAQSIYQPQLQALESLRQLGKSTYETTKTTTEADFQKQMQREIESINARGAYFSGGAIQHEQDLRGQHARDLQQLTLQYQASDFQNLAQQAGLTAEQANYIQNQLFNNENSAYNRAWNQYVQGYQMYQDQQQMLEQQRQFNLNLQFDMAKFAKDFGLSEKEAKKKWKNMDAQQKADELKRQQDQANLEWERTNLTKYQTDYLDYLKTKNDREA